MSKGKKHSSKREKSKTSSSTPADGAAPRRILEPGARRHKFTSPPEPPSRMKNDPTMVRKEDRKKSPHVSGMVKITTS